MKKMQNATTIAGLIYENKLEEKVTGPTSKNPNTKYIAGTIDIATDDDCTNIVSVHFTYVTPVTSTGKNNLTYTILSNICNGFYKTVMKDGKDAATKISVNSAIGLNEFYSDRNGKPELVSAKRNEGGFVTLIDVLPGADSRDTFIVDMIATGFRRIEADPDRELPEKGILKGAIFDFRGAILPVEFSVLNAAAMNYFEDQNISPENPFCTQVWGHQVSQTIVRTETTESAFGESHVREISSTRRDFVITGARTEPYEWDSDEFITAEELSKGMADREVYLATMKQRQDEYKASRGNAPAATANPASKNKAFNF